MWNYIKIKKEETKLSSPKSGAGFTLVELLVSIFIVALISGSVMASYQTGQKQYNAMQAAQKFSSNLRQVQNMAISGKNQGAVTPKGYGLVVSSASRYKTFYNPDDGNFLYNANSVDLETVNLPANVSLSSVGSVVFFVPPDPKTYINNVSPGTLVFVIGSSGASKNIAVYSSGLIDVN